MSSLSIYSTASYSTASRLGHSIKKTENYSSIAKDVALSAALL